MSASLTLRLMSRDPTWIMTLGLAVGATFLLPLAPPSQGAWWLVLVAARVPRILRRACVQLNILILLALLTIGVPGAYGLGQHWLSRLSATLPQEPLPLTASLVFVLALLYWALEKAFDQVVFPKEKV